MFITSLACDSGSSSSCESNDGGIPRSDWLKPVQSCNLQLLEKRVWGNKVTEIMDQ